jgi:hypothetical protein
MENKEFKLRNTELDNVLRYLFDHARTFVKSSVESKDGVLYHHDIANIYTPQKNKMAITENFYMTRGDAIIQIAEHSEQTSANIWRAVPEYNLRTDCIVFEGWQLQVNSVLFKVEFDPYYSNSVEAILQDLHNAFEQDTQLADLDTPTNPAPQSSQFSQPTSIVGFPNWGTLTGRRDEQGEYDISGKVSSKAFNEIAQSAFSHNSDGVLPFSPNEFDTHLPTLKSTDTPLHGKTVKAEKPKMRKENKIPNMPSKNADAYRWVLAWEQIESKIQSDPTLKIDYDELREYLKSFSLDFKDDTLRKIVKRGLAKGIPTRADFERKNKM